ncbi:MAG: heme lyase CcmF/NrfE family subunit [Gammaproteobacteria bacterium]|nr:heme lyase CcmF/NrfE family subunit [Gammaproteobacteria bacterium]
MVAEFGLFALWIAFAASLLLAVVPMVGSYRDSSLLMTVDRPLARVLFIALSGSVIALAIAFLNDDFSVAYVANHSNSLLPWYYKITAVWGSHEGSVLFQLWILSIWIIAFSLFSKRVDTVLRARVLSVLGLVSLGFCAFILFTSSPFERLLPFAPGEGSDLNPLLQDFGMIIHPPLLYIGYVGFAISYGFAIAALLSNRLDREWARWARPWTAIAMGFLTLGIVIGSWWAYAELGWGGWWFWDPVENASLMPWLVGVALVHSLSVSEQRGAFLSWTLLLSISAFSLSLLGAFLVRSGVITSVHAFASDPERGMFILWILFIAVGGGLLLYALKLPKNLKAKPFGLTGREFFLLLNNVFLVVITVTVLIGTLWPLIADALNWGKISVGAQYFNAIAIPMFTLMSVLVPIGVYANWGGSSSELGSKLLVPIALSLLIALGAGALIDFSLSTILVWWLGCWLLVATLDQLRRATAGFNKTKLMSLRSGLWGMYLSHAGIGVAIIGVGMTTLHSAEVDVRMGEGDSHVVGSYEFTLREFAPLRGPNYQSESATIDVYYRERLVATLVPEKRRYVATGQIMTEAAVDDGLTRDLYVALGEPLDNGDWAVRLQVKSFMRWVWYGGAMIFLGGLLAGFDRRYRRKYE